MNVVREVIAIYCENRQWRIRMRWPGLAEGHGMPPPLQTLQEIKMNHAALSKVTTNANVNVVTHNHYRLKKKSDLKFLHAIK